MDSQNPPTTNPYESKTNSLFQKKELLSDETSFVQDRLWLISQLKTYDTSYNISATIRLTGVLEVNVFKECFEKTLHRHKILHTSFIVADGVIKPHTAFDEIPVLEIHDLKPLSEAERTLRIDYFSHEQPIFDLTDPPLLIAVLFQLKTDESLLFVKTHQIVADSYSVELMLQDLAFLYTTRHASGDFLDLADPNLQYQPFATWQRQYIDNPACNHHLQYWSNQFDDPPSDLTLPITRNNTSHGLSISTNQPFEIPESVIKPLNQITQAQNVTRQAVLLATFQFLLHFYTKEVNIVVGIPTSYRDLEPFASVIGPLINYLPVQTVFTKDLTFRRLVKNLHETVAEVLDHQVVPLEKIEQLAHLQQQTLDNPLCKIMFVMNNQPLGKIDMGAGVTGECITIQQGLSGADLRLEFFEADEIGQNLTGKIEYNSKRFCQDDIARFIQQFLAVLEFVTVSPDVTMAEIPIVTPNELQQFCHGYNHSLPQPIAAHSTCELFAAQARQLPDAVAIIAPRKHKTNRGIVPALTYKQLDEQSTQLARYLRKLSIERGSVVGVFVSRLPYMVTAMLGVLKTGATYVPLNPIHPPSYLAHIINDAKMSAVITEQGLIAQINNPNSELIFIDTDWSLIARERCEPFEEQLSLEQIACVIYNSSKLGRPIGVQITHQALVHRLAALKKALNITAHDTFLSLAPLASDRAFVEILLPLVSGARVILADEETARSGRDLVEWVQSCGITVMQATPSLWQKMVEVDWVVRHKQLKILSCGESLSPYLATKLRDKSAALWNVYGLTETTACAAIHEVTSQDVEDGAIPIGQFLANMHGYILDDNLRPCPIGVPGNLYIGGDGVAQRYIHDGTIKSVEQLSGPQINGIEAPLTELYNTGDLARYLPDGGIEWVGRTDRQIKTRHGRVEPIEIETLLEKYSNIAQAIVTTGPDGTSNQTRLVAYLVLDNQISFRVHQLRDYLKALLPPHMIPSHFVVLDKLPMNQAGQVDYAALPTPQPVIKTFEPSHVDVADLTPIDLQMIAVWETLFEKQPIGPDDNFFELGGSLTLAISLLHHIKKTFGQTLALETLLETPTIRQLNRILKQRGVTVSWTSLVGGKPKISRRPFFFIHHGEGTLANYQNFVDCLGNERSFYGVQSLGWSQEALQPEFKRHVAAEYIKKIQTVHPRTTAILGGFRHGGLVALEMAQQLQAQDTPPPLLVLIDPPTEWLPQNHINLSIVRHTLEKLATHRWFKPRQPPLYIGETLVISSSLTTTSFYHGLESLISQLIIEELPHPKLNIFYGRNAKAVAAKLKPYLDSSK